MTYQTGDRVFCPSYMLPTSVNSTEIWGTVKVTPRCTWVLLDEKIKESLKVKITTYPFRKKSPTAEVAAVKVEKKDAYLDAYLKSEADRAAELKAKQDAVIAEYESQSDQQRLPFHQINEIKIGDIVTRIDCGFAQSYTITKIVDKDPWRSGLGQVGFQLFYGIDHRSKRDCELGYFIDGVVFVKTVK